MWDTRAIAGHSGTIGLRKQVATLEPSRFLSCLVLSRLVLSRLGLLGLGIGLGIGLGFGLACLVLVFLVLVLVLV